MLAVAWMVSFGWLVGWYGSISAAINHAASTRRRMEVLFQPWIGSNVNRIKEYAAKNKRHFNWNKIVSLFCTFLVMCSTSTYQDLMCDTRTHVTAMLSFHIGAQCLFLCWLDDVLQ